MLNSLTKYWIVSSTGEMVFETNDLFYIGNCLPPFPPSLQISLPQMEYLRNECRVRGKGNVWEAGKILREYYEKVKKHQIFD